MDMHPNIVLGAGASVTGHTGPSINSNINVDDMLNLGTLDRMDEEFGKGD